MRTCKKLHICRHIDHCERPSCDFPHDFNREPNRSIVANHNCTRINPVTLVKLLRLSKGNARLPGTTGRGGQRRGGRGRRNPGRIRKNPHRQNLRPLLDQINDEDRRIDVCFPSSQITNQLDIDDVKLLLSFKNINVKTILENSENEYCHRTTLQLQSVTGKTFETDRFFSNCKSIFLIRCGQISSRGCSSSSRFRH